MRVVIILIGLILTCSLYNCSNVNNRIGDYYNKDFDALISLGDSFRYSYYVGGSLFNVGRFEIDSDGIIFHEWKDNHKYSIYNCIENPCLCVVNMDDFSIIFSEDERFKNFHRIDREIPRSR